MKVYVVSITIYKDFYDDISNETIIYKNYEKAMRFVLNKRKECAKKYIITEIENAKHTISTGGSFCGGDRNSKEYINRRKEEVERLKIELIQKNKDLKFLNEIRDVMACEAKINEISDRNRWNFSSSYTMEEKKVIF